MPAIDPLETELVTDANFDAQRYLLACKDLHAHFEVVLDPWQHFDLYGRHESRRQLGGLPRIAPEARSAGVTLCAIAKDEGPYLIEWVAHHRLLGINRIVIYNNDSSDGSDRLLDGMATAGLIEHRIWPSVAGRSAQRSAYGDAAARCTTRWIMFLDLDEFFAPTDGGSIDAFLGRFAPDVSAIAMNWRVFGSAGLIERDDRPVIERFTQAAPLNHHVNRHCKTLAVAAHLYGVDPHRVQLMRGRYVNAVGEDIDPGRGFTPPRHDNVQINHYVLKSRAEFEDKRRRGCVLRYPEDPARFSHRDGPYFALHDLNDQEDSTLIATLPALRAEMARIESLAVAATDCDSLR